APRVVERTRCYESAYKMPTEIERAHDPVATARNRIELLGVLRSKCHKQLISDNLHSERSKTRWQAWIAQGPRRSETRIKKLNDSVVKIGHSQFRRGSRRVQDRKRSINSARLRIVDLKSRFRRNISLSIYTPKKDATVGGGNNRRKSKLVAVRAGKNKIGVDHHSRSACLGGTGHIGHSKGGGAYVQTFGIRSHHSAIPATRNQEKPLRHRGNSPRAF